MAFFFNRKRKKEASATPEGPKGDYGTGVELPVSGLNPVVFSVLKSGLTQDAVTDLLEAKPTVASSVLDLMQATARNPLPASLARRHAWIYRYTHKGEPVGTIDLMFEDGILTEYQFSEELMALAGDLS